MTATLSSIVRSRDRITALEPMYSIGAPVRSSTWIRRGRRREDDLDVVITILPGRGSEASLDSLRAYLRPFVDTNTALGALRRGDDIYVVWPWVGALDLEEWLERGQGTPEELARIERALNNELERWRHMRRGHGALRPKSVRLSQDLERAWFVLPDLERAIERLPFGRRGIDASTVARLLGEFRVQDEPTMSTPPWPIGRRAEFSELNTWRTLGPEPVLVCHAPHHFGTSTLLHAVAREATKHGDIVVEAFSQETPGGADDLHRLMLDELGLAVASMPIMKLRRVLEELRSSLGGHYGVLVQTSEPWRRLFEVGASSTSRDTFDSTRSRERDGSGSLATCLSRVTSTLERHAPVLVVLHDVDAEQQWFTTLILQLLDHSRGKTRFLVSSTAPSILDRIARAVRVVELGHYSERTLGEVLCEHLGRQDPSSVAHLAALLLTHMNLAPEELLEATTLAEQLGWLEHTEDGYDIDLQRIEDLATLLGDPDAFLSTLSANGLDAELLQCAALATSAFTFERLAMRTSRSDEDVFDFIEHASLRGLLSRRHDDSWVLTGHVRELLERTLTDERKTELHRVMASASIANDAPARELIEHLLGGWRADERLAEHLTLLVRGALFGRSQHDEALFDAISSGLTFPGFDDPLTETQGRMLLVQRALEQGHTRTAHTLLDDIPSDAPPRAKALGWRARALLHTMSGDYERALHVALDALDELDATLPRRGDSLAGVMARIERNWDVFDELDGADELERGIQSLLGTLLPTSFVARHDIFADVVVALVERTLEHGLTHDSPRGLTTLAQLACTRLDDPDFGRRLGLIASTLVSREPWHPYTAIIHSDLANFILQWSGAFEECMQHNRDGIAWADAFHELQYGGYLRMHDLYNRLGLGQPVGALQEYAHQGLERVQQNDLARRALFTASRGLARMAEHGGTLWVDEGAPGLVLMIHHTFMANIAAIDRDDDALAEHSRALEASLGDTEGWASPLIHHLYMRALDASRNARPDDLSDASLRLQMLCERIEVIGPAVFHVRALESAHDGHVQGALALFERAMSSARASKCWSVLALAAEDAAHVATRVGASHHATAFQRAAAEAYAHWGVDYKARELGWSTSLQATEPFTTPNTLDTFRRHMSEAIHGLERHLDSECTHLHIVYRGTRGLTISRSSGEGWLAASSRSLDAQTHDLSLIYAALNTMLPQHGDNATFVPCAADEASMVFTLVPEVIPREPHVIEACAQAIAPFARLWITERDRDLHERALSDLLGSLQDRGMLIDLQGRALSRGTATTLPPNVVVAARRAADSDEARTVERVLIGDEIVDVTLVPFVEILGLRNDVEPVLMLVRDVSRRELDRQLQATQREITLIKRMARGIAHDLNNSVMLMSLIAQEAELDEELAQSAKASLGQSTRIIARLQAFSNEHAEFEPTLIDVRAFVSELAPLYQVLFEAKHDFIVVLPDTQIMALANEQILDRALLNLIVNARQALAETPGRITLRLERGPDSDVLLTVEDDGPGISVAMLDAILDEGVSTKGSSGLGLHIVREELSRIDATLEVSSTLGKGSTFSIRLPAWNEPNDSERAEP